MGASKERTETAGVCVGGMEVGGHALITLENSGGLRADRLLI